MFDETNKQNEGNLVAVLIGTLDSPAELFLTLFMTDRAAYCLKVGNFVINIS